MVQTSSAEKNIWVAASDGDIDRVKYLIEQGQSPNAKDSNSYTPVHAAASYAHLELLDFLLAVGGDINLTDDEGETPLFTVETLPAARQLIAKGADVDHRNEEGMTAAEYLQEDHPEISDYLLSLSSSSSSDSSQPPPPTHQPSDPLPSALAVENFTDAQTSTLMEQAREIMEQSERDGVAPDERLREIVERAVAEGVAFGGANGGAANVDGELEEDRKRTRMNGD